MSQVKAPADSSIFLAAAGDKSNGSNGAPAGSLEEDDEFEDFPVEDWNEDESGVKLPGDEKTTLWEDNWDEDDIEEDFAAQLKYEYRIV